MTCLHAFATGWLPHAKAPCVLPAWAHAAPRNAATARAACLPRRHMWGAHVAPRCCARCALPRAALPPLNTVYSTLALCLRLPCLR